MIRINTPRLLASLLMALTAGPSFAATQYCIAVSGGFGHGGTTFVDPAFVLPANGTCSPWSGFTKTASTVVLTTTGAGCISTDGKVLTLSAISADPNYFGPGQLQSDFIRLTRASTTVGFGPGSDSGYFSGSARPVTCTTALLGLPDNPD